MHSPFLNPESAIGIFDSGIGGLTVMSELVRMLPYEQMIYYADSKRLPYGTKTAEEIRSYALEAGNWLVTHGVKLIVLACHTATACALETLQKELPVPVIGIIEPGLKLLMQTTRSQKVAVLGTPRLISSNTYQCRIREHSKEATIYAIACPMFAPLAEEMLFDDPATLFIARHYLSPLRTANIDAILLACTHYPLLKPTLQKVLDPSLPLLEPAKPCAEAVARYLNEHSLLSNRSDPPILSFFASANPQKLCAFAQIILCKTISAQQS